MSQATQAEDTLAALNSKTLGAKMPIVTLPDGTKIQTGTIGALIKNIAAYDEVVAQGSECDTEAKRELENKLTASFPMLIKSGIFDLFTPEEWVRGSSAGRKLVGEFALRDGIAGRK